MRLLRRRARGEHGASLVEFALIAPVFFMLVLGMFTGAVAYNQQLQLSHAAREGTRYGATLPQNQTFTAPATWATTVRDITVGRSAGDLTIQRVCVALVEGASATPVSNEHVWRGSESGAPATGGCFTDSSGDTDKRVQVRVQRPGRIEALLFSVNVTLSSEAIGRHEG